MYKKIVIFLAVFSMTVSLSTLAQAQGVENMVWGKKLERQIGFLTENICEGRAPGSRGANIAGFWICDQFAKAGVMQIDSSYSKSFSFGDDRTGHNIVGMISGSKKNPRERYIIIGAHYDHLGKINGTVYPGADANASGVAAMINLASMFSYMKMIGRVYDKNILLVAFDAKEASMAGSDALWQMLEAGTMHDPQTGKPITADKIDLVVNIDQIGSSMSPLRSGREDFLIMLGNNTIAKSEQDMAMFVNQIYHTNLEIAFDYYGSAKFTEMFFKRVTDLRVFVEHNKPSILFTSGITMKTNKPTDTVETLNLDVLSRRVIFIFHWIENML